MDLSSLLIVHESSPKQIAKIFQSGHTGNEPGLRQGYPASFCLYSNFYTEKTLTSAGFKLGSS